MQRGALTAATWGSGGRAPPDSCRPAPSRPSRWPQTGCPCAAGAPAHWAAGGTPPAWAHADALNMLQAAVLADLT